jgi:replicative DNA helicase
MAEFEPALLAQMIRDRQVLYASGIKAQHFPAGPQRVLFETLSRLYEEAKSVDAFMIRGVVNDEVWNYYTERVADAAPSTSNWRYYRDAVIQHYRHRRTVEILEEGKSRAHEPDIAEWIIRELAHTEDASGHELITQGEFVDDYLREILRRRENAGKTPGIPTGIAKLDGLTHGFQDRRLILVGARPSHGKTALMTTFVSNMVRTGYAAGIVSLESSRYELTERMVANIANVVNEDLATGRVDEVEMKRVVDLADRMKSGEWIVPISDNPYLTIDGVRARIREMVIAHKVDIVFVDYVQRIRPRDHNQPFRLHIAECSGELKSLAEDLNIPVVALAQLGRDADAGRPRLSHFKESGQLEQDADIGILISAGEDGIALDVAKNRDGRRAMVPVEFHPSRMRFTGQE